MSSVHNSVDTVNAAATAIVTAESRVQPSTVEKRRWGSCWSIYWCFGSHKHSKRIGHAVLISEPSPSGRITAPISENRNHSSTITLPFIAPPSSPASFLQSDPSSSTQSPATGLLSLASLSAHSHSPGGTPPIFTIGPYAHETQLVSPPVFSTFTTEPSTASFTPPPEPVQMTTPSSPEVPFAQLLSSSLAKSRRSNGNNLKYAFSQYEFQPYQYPASPGGHIKSPGSAISTSGTSSPFPDNRAKFFGYEHFPSYKWDSRVGSGSLTPNGWGSRLGSGALTPNGGEPPSRDSSSILENQIYEVASLANSDNKSQSDDAVVDHHRVSFELFGEDIPTCTVREPAPSDKEAFIKPREEIRRGTNNEEFFITKHSDNLNKETVSEVRGVPLDSEGEDLDLKHRTISFGSSKDFNFNNAKEEEVSEKSSVDCEWWINENGVTKELSPRNSWSFFPMLQSGAS
ncbi:hypothetical protein ABFS83_06G107700 [Erythranthe nasuta]